MSPVPLFAILALAAPASAPADPAGAVVDKGRIVSSQHVIWRPRAAVGEAFEGYIYEFERADGSRQKMAARDGKDMPKGAEVYVVTGGPRLTLVDAKTYTPPKPGPAPAPAAADAPIGPNPVAPVTVRGRKVYATISEARENAVGDDWKRIYCETSAVLGSRVPRQVCLPLRIWDIRHQEMDLIRELTQITSPSGKITGGAG